MLALAPVARAEPKLLDADRKTLEAWAKRPAKGLPAPLLSLYVMGNTYFNLENVAEIHAANLAKLGPDDADKWREHAAALTELVGSLVMEYDVSLHTHQHAPRSVLTGIAANWRHRSHDTVHYDKWIGGFLAKPEVRRAIKDAYWQGGVRLAGDLGDSSDTTVAHAKTLRTYALHALTRMGGGDDNDEIRRLIQNPQAGLDGIRFQALGELERRHPGRYARAVQGEYLKRLDLIRRLSADQLAEPPEPGGRTPDPKPGNRLAKEAFAGIRFVPGAFFTQALLDVAGSEKFPTAVRHEALEHLSLRAAHLEAERPAIGHVFQDVAVGSGTPPSLRMAALQGAHNAAPPDLALFATVVLKNPLGQSEKVELLKALDRHLSQAKLDAWQRQRLAGAVAPLLSEGDGTWPAQVLRSTLGRDAARPLTDELRRRLTRPGATPWAMASQAARAATLDESSPNEGLRKLVDLILLLLPHHVSGNNHEAQNEAWLTMLRLMKALPSPPAPLSTAQVNRALGALSSLLAKLETDGNANHSILRSEILNAADQLTRAGRGDGEELAIDGRIGRWLIERRALLAERNGATGVNPMELLDRLPFAPSGLPIQDLLGSSRRDVRLTGLVLAARGPGAHSTALEAAAKGRDPFEAGLATYLALQGKAMGPAGQPGKLPPDRADAIAHRVRDAAQAAADDPRNPEGTFQVEGKSPNAKRITIERGRDCDRAIWLGIDGKPPVSASLRSEGTLTIDGTHHKAATTGTPPFYLHLSEGDHGTPRPHWTISIDNSSGSPLARVPAKVPEIDPLSKAACRVPAESVPASASGTVFRETLFGTCLSLLQPGAPYAFRRSAALDLLVLLKADRSLPATARALLLTSLMTRTDSAEIFALLAPELERVAPLDLPAGGLAALERLLEPMAKRERQITRGELCGGAVLVHDADWIREFIRTRKVPLGQFPRRPDPGGHR